MKIYIDADGCPVKEEVYRVARRYRLKVHLVANSVMRIPQDDLIESTIVNDHMDAADDWIVENVKPDDIVITGDIPLASRVLEKGAMALGLKGREFTEHNIGGAMASREISSFLRESGIMTGGPAPFQKKDRSAFLQSLDRIIQSSRRCSSPL